MAIFRYSHWLLGSWMRKIYLLGNGFSQNWLVVYLMTSLGDSLRPAQGH
uniref:Uncharacterized protein n=1 Tax=Brassica oleracea TaxID=3712 RepID=A0A3P6CBK7_BRAOL|nr:unnamed protein product [Brassica oleracea]